MSARLLTLRIAAGLLTSTAIVAATGAAAAAASSHPSGAIAAAGTGRATARTADVRTMQAGRQLPNNPRPFGALGRDGRPTGSTLPARSSGGAKPVPLATPATTGANILPGRTVAPRTAPAINANFAGVNQSGSNCGGCQPPDVNAAVGSTQIVEAVNLRMQVYDKAGNVQCGVGLNTFLNTTDSLSDPRVQYDNLNNRFSMVVIPVPASSTATPALYLLTSQSANACGSWFVFRITFSGSLYPAGTLLDYPMLGQDRNAILVSTNNFDPGYINSAAFAVPKAAAYAGAGFSFSSFPVAFSSAPVSVAGNPILATANSYFLASLPGTGYNLYRMTNSAGPGTTLALQATVSSAFNAPPRRINQPGTSVTLDPLDGRIVWSPVNDGNFIWFAHGIAIGSFPGVRYGAISIAGNTAQVANAFRSGTSDDFNPSIGVANAPGGGNFIYVNWAYTDTAAGVGTSDTVDTVAPGAGVPALIGTGAVLVNGSATSTNSRFGDYSSVSIDPSIGSGSCAVTAQQYFGGDGQWNTRIGRVGSC